MKSNSISLYDPPGVGAIPPLPKWQDYLARRVEPELRAAGAYS